MCKKVYMQEIYYSQNTEKLLICGLVEWFVVKNYYLFYGSHFYGSQFFWVPLFWDGSHFYGSHFFGTGPTFMGPGSRVPGPRTGS